MMPFKDPVFVLVKDQSDVVFQYKNSWVIKLLGYGVIQGHTSN